MNTELPASDSKMSKDMNSLTDVQRKPKRKGPKPSSKKRLENHRLQKGHDTVKEIHRAAMERTSVSLDTLLNCLNNMQIVQQKQEAIVPITTRGAGFLTQECYDEAVIQHPKAARACNVNQAYRVVLAQQQLQLLKSEENALLNDPTVMQIETELPSIDATMQQAIASTPQSFRLTADLINTIGKCEVGQTNYRPVILSPKIKSSSIPVTSTKRRREYSDLLPDPYAVTFKNLRETVEALSSPQTPIEARRYFYDNNPIPGAVFSEGLLTNANDIMPAGYDVANLARDQRHFRAMLGMLSSKSQHLVGECVFNGIGNPGQLVTCYQEQFKIVGSELHFPVGEVRFRCIRQMEPGFAVRGALSLLGEYPITAPTDRNLYGIREPAGHDSYIDVSWSMLVGRALAR